MRGWWTGGSRTFAMTTAALAAGAAAAGTFGGSSPYPAGTSWRKMAL
jgi:hypothetical protein